MVQREKGACGVKWPVELVREVTNGGQGRCKVDEMCATHPCTA